MLHAGREPQLFAVPQIAAELNWRLLVDTAAESPNDIYPDADGPPPGAQPLVLAAHALRCYVAE
jgi:isoamylase